MIPNYLDPNVSEYKKGPVRDRVFFWRDPLKEFAEEFNEKGFETVELSIIEHRNSVYRNRSTSKYELIAEPKGDYDLILRSMKSRTPSLGPDELETKLKIFQENVSEIFEELGEEDNIEYEFVDIEPYREYYENWLEENGDLY